MQFTVDGQITRCAGNNHFSIPLEFAGGATAVLRVELAELQFDPVEDLSVTRELVIARLRSAAKEANATTFAQVRAALENQTFEV